jgi:hypothetical protein
VLVYASRYKGRVPMKGILRIINAVVWLGVWLGVARALHSFDDPLKLIAEAVIPLALWFAIDRALRRSEL